MGDPPCIGKCFGPGCCFDSRYPLEARKPDSSLAKEYCVTLLLGYGGQIVSYSMWNTDIQQYTSVRL